MEEELRKNNPRHPSVWLIPCAPDIYDAEGAFAEYGSIIWHQDCRGIRAGDIAYIYATAPRKRIICKCIVTEAGLPFCPQEDDGYEIDEAFCNRSHKRFMEIKQTETYDNPLLGYGFLLQNGLTGAIRSQRRAVPELAEYIEKTANE